MQLKAAIIIISLLGSTAILRSDAQSDTIDRTCDSGAVCQEGSRCTNGLTETCCGETFDSFKCECDNGQYICMNTDACMRPQCETDVSTTAATAAMIRDDASTTAAMTKDDLTCDSGAVCLEEGSTCTNGLTETCCGETFDSFKCECSNGQYVCRYTDKCMHPSCDKTEPPSPATIGGGVDEHGCYPSAGYTWCPELAECIQGFETPCPLVGTDFEGPVTISCSSGRCSLPDGCLIKMGTSYAGGPYMDGMDGEYPIPDGCTATCDGCSAAADDASVLEADPSPAEPGSVLTDAPSPASTPTVGGEPDEYGCLPTAGYTWCAELDECITGFDTPCPVVGTDFEGPVTISCTSGRGSLPDGCLINMGTSYAGGPYMNGMDGEYPIPDGCTATCDGCSAAADDASVLEADPSPAEPGSVLTDAPSPASTPTVGGEPDEYGCLPTAGYTWCAELDECITGFDTPCPVVGTDFEGPVTISCTSGRCSLPDGCLINMGTSYAGGPYMNGMDGEYPIPDGCTATCDGCSAAADDASVLEADPSPAEPGSVLTDAPSPASTPTVGGEPDEYGCLPTAGYTWCAELDECITGFDTPCPVVGTDFEGPVTISCTSGRGSLPDGCLINMGTSYAGGPYMNGMDGEYPIPDGCTATCDGCSDADDDSALTEPSSANALSVIQQMAAVSMLSLVVSMLA
eukprot:CAMPEP_0172328862 /NCGR_PEP_ID=MMETSP1058-20130122/60571_1 /TAXON_ID=83371 /ORGANISM="Detonula confervacea, Strain CCMP 353" /LENGTH=686 /DNA_ID=CAMNT_0013045995 /DNA_START=34 /DNA_END=2094 /DNA_ORIENTATION=+